MKAGEDDQLFHRAVNRLSVCNADAALHEQAISERIRTETALRLRNEDLERSNAELQQFACSAAHDLQEPLRAVAVCVELLRKRYAGQIDERADEYIGHAVTNIERMRLLIGNLLALSRVGAGNLNVTAVNCDEALDRAVENLGTAIEECGAIIERQPLPELRADASQLVQLFQNLIGNALKFRKAPSPTVRVGCERRTNDYVFSIGDDGIGIESRHFDLIFTAFQRLHSQASYPGAGIGLSLCARIVAAHRGKIWLDSTPEVGSTFYFSIPVLTDTL